MTHTPLEAEIDRLRGINKELLAACEYVAKRLSAGDPLGDSLKVLDYAIAKARGKHD